MKALLWFVVGLVCCLSVPVHAEPTSIGPFGVVVDLEERQGRTRRIEDERLKRERLRFEMEKQRFEMERQRFEMEMLERKKALQSEYPTDVEMKEGIYVREGKFPREEPKVRYQGRKSSREERAAARAAKRLQQERERRNENIEEE